MAFFVTGNIYYQKQLIYHIDTILTQINRKPYSKSCIRNMNKLQMLRRRSSDSASVCLHLLLAMGWNNNPRKALFKQSICPPNLLICCIRPSGRVGSKKVVYLMLLLYSESNCRNNPNALSNIITFVPAWIHLDTPSLDTLF